MPKFYAILGIFASALLSCFTPRHDCSAAEGFIPQSRMMMCYLLDTREARVALPMKKNQFISRAAASCIVSMWDFKPANLIKGGKYHWWQALAFSAEKVEQGILGVGTAWVSARCAGGVCLVLGAVSAFVPPNPPAGAPRPSAWCRALHPASCYLREQGRREGFPGR